MKEVKYVLTVFYIYFVLIIGCIAVKALTPSSNTYIDAGYTSYSIELAGGGTVASHRTSNAGVYRLTDTDGNAIYCAELGKDYPRDLNLTKSNSSPITNSGQICGIISAFNNSQSGGSGETYVLNGTTYHVKITYNDIKNQATDNDSYKKIQQILWKYQNHSGTCTKTYVNTYYSEEKTEPTATLTATNVTEEGNNYVMTITLTINNSNNALTSEDPVIKIDGVAKTFTKTVDGSNYKYSYKYSIAKSSYSSKNISVSYTFNYNNRKINKQYPYLDRYTAPSGYQDIVVLKLGTDTTQDQDSVFGSKTVTFSLNEGKILVEKYQKGTENKIDTATFGLFSNNTCTTVAKNIYGADVANINTAGGVATFDHLLYGTYYVKEIISPSGYFKMMIVLK